MSNDVNDSIAYGLSCESLMLEITKAKAKIVYNVL